MDPKNRVSHNHLHISQQFQNLTEKRLGYQVQNLHLELLPPVSEPRRSLSEEVEAIFRRPVLKGNEVGEAALEPGVGVQHLVDVTRVPRDDDDHA